MSRTILLFSGRTWTLFLGHFFPVSSMITSYHFVAYVCITIDRFKDKKNIFYYKKRPSFCSFWYATPKLVA
jgi:hypothetical protein